MGGLGQSTDPGRSPEGRSRDRPQQQARALLARPRRSDPRAQYLRPKIRARL